MPEQGARLFPYESAEAVFNEHRETTRGRDLDITGLSYALLDQAPQQWPFPHGAASRHGALVCGWRLSHRQRARAASIAAPYRPVAEPIDARYPLHLNTGRLRDQWHAMSRTGKVARLFAHVDAPLLSMAQRDMELRRLKAGELVRVKSRRGEVVVAVEASDTVRPGQCFLPMHWGARFMGGLGINALTLPVFDAVSKTTRTQARRRCRWRRPTCPGAWSRSRWATARSCSTPCSPCCAPATTRPPVSPAASATC